MKTKRILSRILAKELTPEELDIIRGSADTVVAADAAAAGDEGSVPLSTLVATLPDYSEDR